MITEAILNFFASAITWLQGLFPDWDLNIVTDLEGFLAKLNPFVNLLGWLNQYLPIAEACVLLSAALVFWMAAHIFNIVSWLLSKLHIAGGTT